VAINISVNGLSLIVRKAYIMGNGQPTKTGNESESKVVTSGDLTESRLVAVTGKPELKTSSITDTTATMQKDSQKTLQNVKLQELRSKAGLVAGAMQDFQEAGGTVVRQEMTYNLPSGSYKAIKFIIAVKENDLVAVQTNDGIEFDLVER